MKPFEKVILKKRPYNLFLNIKKGDSITRAGKRTLINPANNCFNLMKFFEKKGLIHTEKPGRDRVIFITEKGKEFKILLIELLKMVREADKNSKLSIFNGGNRS